MTKDLRKKMLFMKQCTGRFGFLVFLYYILLEKYFFCLGRLEVLREQFNFHAITILCVSV